jgi:hypothetical protein
MRRPSTSGKLHVTDAFVATPSRPDPPVKRSDAVAVPGGTDDGAPRDELVEVGTDA